jgi:hypothetical protein
MGPVLQQAPMKTPPTTVMLPEVAIEMAAPRKRRRTVEQSALIDFTADRVPLAAKC